MSISVVHIVTLESFNWVDIPLYFNLNLFNNLVGRIMGHWAKEKLYENFLPPLEVDRVWRGFLFTNIKGRNLVRLAAR